MTSLLMAIAILASVHGAAAQPPATRSYELGRQDSFEIDVPAAWKDTVTRPPGGRPPNISLVAGGADELLVTVTPVWDPKGDRSFTSPETVRRIVEQSGQHLLPGSEEKSLTLEPLSGPTARGFHFTLSDKSVTGRGTVENYPYITQGAVATGDLVVVFSIFHRTKAGPERAAALAMMATARQQRGPAASAPASAGRTALALPGYPWAVALDLSGFTVIRDETSAERSVRMVSAESADRTLYLSLFIEKQPAAASARGCRTLYQERLARSPIMRDVRVQSSETEFLAFAEYTIERYEGSTINQKHINTYLAHEDVCVDLHLSKVRFTSGDLRLLVPVVRSLAIEPR
jgi:hypothetical protein